MPTLEDALRATIATIDDLNMYGLRKTGPGKELVDRCVKQLTTVRHFLTQEKTLAQNPEKH